MVLLGAGAVFLVLYSTGAFASGVPSDFAGDAAAWEAYKKELAEEKDGGWSITVDTGPAEIEVSDDGIKVDLDLSDVDWSGDWF